MWRGQAPPTPHLGLPPPKVLHRWPRPLAFIIWGFMSISCMRAASTSFSTLPLSRPARPALASSLSNSSLSYFNLSFSNILSENALSLSFAAPHPHPPFIPKSLLQRAGFLRVLSLLSSQMRTPFCSNNWPKRDPLGGHRAQEPWIS